MQNVNSIKTNFEKWLEKHTGANAGTFKTNNDLSIFTFAQEFKEYMSEKLDGDISSMNINDLLELEVKDGQFVIPDETTEETEAEETPLSATPEDGTEKETDDVAGLLNNIFANEEFKTALDANQDGELSKEEISDFLKAISNVDGNADDISLEDIAGAVQGIAEGKKLSEIKAESETTAPETTSETPQITPTSSSSGSSSSGSNYNPTSNDSPKEKTLDNMTSSELNAELGNAKSKLSENQNALSQAIDGTSSTLKGLKDNIDTKYEEYQTALKEKDEGLAQQVDTLKTAIDQKQSEIDENDKAIASQESTVSSAENAYNNAVSTRETLEAQKSELQSADTSNMTEDQKASIAEKLTAIEEKITEAKNNEDDAKTKWDEAKEKLQELKDKKDELTNGENGLTKLQDQMTELENQITEKYPEMQEYIKAYNDAKTEYATAQTKEISAAQKSVNESQEYVNKVQTAITNLNNEDLKKEFSAGTYNAQEGDRLVETARAMLAKYGSSTGLCATGVSRTFKMAYGLDLHGNGCDWDSNMDRLVQQGMFTEVTSDYPSAGDLSSLPAGAVVCWEATGGHSGGGAQYGHVTIADGHGGEISDHYRENIYTSVGGRSDQYRIFIPV